MRDLYLVRHGQAQAGPSGMDADFFLTDLGRRQAHTLGEHLRDAGVAPVVIHASRLTRARQTAEILARYIPAPIAVRDDLIEHGSEAFLLGSDLAAAARQRPAALAADGALRIEPGSAAGLNWDYCVGGETLRELHVRAKGAFDFVHAAHLQSPDQVVIVAHGSILSAMLSEVLRLPLQSVWNFHFACAGMMHLRFCDENPGGIPVICAHGPCGAFPDGSDRSEKLQAPAADPGGA